MARRTKAEAEETKSRILDAAEKLFFELGVTQTSLERIAEEANVTRGAIYWHFADKIELFQAMHQRVRLPQEDIILNTANEGHPDPLRFLEDIAIDCVHTLASDTRMQHVYTILLMRCEYVGDMTQALERQKQASEKMSLHIAQLFRMAHMKKQLAQNWTPETAAHVFGAMMRGLWADWLTFGREFGLVEVGTRSITELFASMRAKQTAAAPALAQHS
ncbi:MULTISPECIES: TetR family transcriptional regulator [unclassified Beijerinckia]|uniref:TetR family transcriptional regulator n=1 Tax=unclassified Beijerinckia TaxID=2638183 RepID=UPI0008991DB0|nr:MULTISPECIES: TetR family transcriptional regulator [unclassified Beijerinckia]MDH7794144.1 AcrR family transcriptional regulator [Beijerinckia sp. GAS462]SEB54296.1 transcriptional regulator, TetR family [Beijerinckia sp. 28-YEA-48]